MEEAIVPLIVSLAEECENFTIRGYVMLLHFLDILNDNYADRDFIIILNERGRSLFFHTTHLNPRPFLVCFCFVCFPFCCVTVLEAVGHK